MKLTTVALALAVLVPAVSGAKTPADKTTDTKKQLKKLNEAEVKILAHVHHVNVTEVDLGKLAQRVGTPPLKKYAEALVADHQVADTALQKLAKEKGVAAIPMPKPETDAEKRMMKDMMDEVAVLKKLKGPDFDRAYLRMMVTHHDEELAKTDSMIEISSDSDLDMMLQNRKATLQRHSDGAKELQKAATVSSK
jgi:putative membrane protein